MFSFSLILASVLSGSVASISGFGIGSILTPLFSLQMATKIAVAAVSIPHFVATLMRFWMLRTHVDKKILLGFGGTSALGGLIGALLHSEFVTSALNTIFGLILIFSGTMGTTGISER